MKSCASASLLVFCSAVYVLSLGPSPLAAHPHSLRPSSASLDRQNHWARLHDFTFLRDPAHLRRFVDRGWLVRVAPGANLRFSSVSFPYARPAVRLFVERLSQQYRAACGDRLVVTSLTRPRSHQPRYASPRSVHPTGMALDLRRSRKRSCRRWIERVLLDLEKKDLLEASYEGGRPHYHIALFPKPYERYVAKLSASQVFAKYRVRRGDNLWTIARRHDTTVNKVRSLNSLRSNRIFPGQTLVIPRD